MKRSFILLVTLLSACIQVDEEVRLTFPAGTKSLIEELVFTVIDPIVVDEDLNRPRFVSCEGLGPFSPTRAIEAGADQPNSDSVLFQDSRPFPVDSLQVSFTPPSGSRNPWGLVAVLVEARAPALALSRDSAQYRQVDATVLKGCYCVRTSDELSDDEDLDREVRQACPLLAEELIQERRDIVMEPVAPPEFRLEPCGTAAGAAPRDGPVLSRPAACLRTQVCSDVTVGGNCFECDGACGELEDRSGAIAEFRVLSAGQGLTPERQLVVTDRFGSAQATLTARNCSQGAQVDARLFGTSDASVAFALGCVDPIPDWSLVASEGLSGQRIRALAGLDPAPDGNGQLVLQTEPLLSDPDGPVQSGLVLFALSQQRLVSTFERTTTGLLPRGILPLPGGGPMGRPAVAVALGEPQASGPIRPDRNVTLRVDAWDGQTMTSVTSSLTAACQACTCGSRTTCTTSMDCPNNPSRPEVCVDGACQEVDCRCELLLEEQNRVRMGAADIDGDGLADLVVGAPDQLTLTTYYSDRSASGALYDEQGCACGRVTPLANTFDLVNFGDDAGLGDRSAPDLVVLASNGAYVSYARQDPRVEPPQVGIACGQAGLIGSQFEARLVRGARFRCPVGTSCPAFEDAVIVGLVDERGLATQETWIRVVFGDDADISSDPDLFDIPGTGALLIPESRDNRAPQDSVALDVGDVNGDGSLDFAVLFRQPAEIRAWLGDGSGGFVEAEGRILLDEDGDCQPLADLVVHDLDGDARDEVAVVCNASASIGEVRVYRGGP